MKQIEVVAAIIQKDNRIFATQRGYGTYKNYWEFPGGKIEAGETKEEALIREIKEELNTTISIDRFLKTISYTYPEFHLVMHCYYASVVEGTLELLEAEDAKWLTIEELDSINWLPADQLVLDDIRKDWKEID